MDYPARREVLRVVALREARLAMEEELREQEAWEMLLLGAREGVFMGAVSKRGGSGGVGPGAQEAGGSIGSPKKHRDSGSGPSVGSSALSPSHPRSYEAAAAGGWRAWLRVCAACEEPGGQVRVRAGRGALSSSSAKR